MLVIDGWTYNELTDGTPTTFIAPCRCCCEQNHASAFGCKIFEARHMVTTEIYVCSYCYVRLKNKKMAVREIVSYLREDSEAVLTELQGTPTNEKARKRGGAPLPNRMGSIRRLVRDLESHADDVFPDDAA